MLSEHESSELARLGAAAWPDLHLEPAVFAAFIAEREGAATASPAVLGDLFLACACVAGDPAAIAAFEARHDPDLAGALARMRLPADVVAEVRQRVRTKLLVRERDAPPRLAHYTGRGSLGGWLRAVAVRTAIDVLREERASELPTDAALVDVFVEHDAEPALAALKQRYATEVNEAFAHGFASLTPRQRNLLRQHYLHGVAIEQIAPMYGVHRVTIFRWIAQARLDVLAAARRRLAPRFDGDTEAASQVLELLQSQLDLSLDRLLRTIA